MLQIQDVGLEIMNHTPRKLYIFAGYEYGIKHKYIDILKEQYGNLIEAPSALELVEYFTVKRLTPTPPAVYVVRYDTEFQTALDQKLATKIQTLNIIGTIVCLYQGDSCVSKFDKFLPDNVVCVSKVSDAFVTRYLKSDYPDLPDKFLALAAQNSEDYYQAQLICNCWSAVDPQDLYSLTDTQLLELGGISTISQDVQLKHAVASRNFAAIDAAIHNYIGDANQAIYVFLSTLLEIDKFLDVKYGQSDILNYVKRWTHQDTYNMFMNAYHELIQSRTISGDFYDRLRYLAALESFSTIPEVETLC